MSNDAKHIFELASQDADLAQSLSKGAQQIYQRMAQRKIREESASRQWEGSMVIQAKAFEGAAGRVDAQGRVYDSAGQYVIQIDLQTGKILLNRTGDEIGTFLPNCQYSEYRLIELIRQNDTSKNPGWYAGGAATSSATPTANWGVETHGTPIHASTAASVTKEENNSWW